MAGRYMIYCKSSPPIRRSKFRYSKCAQQTFIYGSTTACGRMKVTVYAAAAVRQVKYLVKKKDM